MCTDQRENKKDKEKDPNDNDTKDKPAKSNMMPVIMTFAVVAGVAAFAI